MSTSPELKPSTDALVGRVLDGRFRIIAPIARGGMGAVYKAEQAPLGRLVALKVLAPRGEPEGNAEFRRRFLLEASTSAKLTHPNTVRVFDYGQTEDGYFFIAMELLEGKTLKQLIAEGGAIEPARAAEIAKQVCRSLREAHRMGVVHRDIKPGNVMLVDRGGEEAAKVLDFGLAKDLSVTSAPGEADATQTGVFLGSPKYVSPEQVQGESLDARSDVYALGVVLYEMLAGRPPFAHEQPMQVLMAHVQDAPPKLVAPDGREPVPPALEAIVMRCLAKAKEDRWPDMEALLVALKDWQGTTSVSGDLLLSASHDASQDAGDARSGVHVVGQSSPMIPEVSVEPTEPPRRRPPSENGTSAEMGSGGVASGPLVVGVLLVAGAVGGAVWWLQRPTDAVPPPPASPPVAAIAPPAAAPAERIGETTAEEPIEAPTLEPEATSASVMLALRSTPPGAMVRIGERTYGPTPTDIELVGEMATPGTELELVFERAGFRSATEHATVGEEPLTIEARLRTLVRPGSGGSIADRDPEPATTSGEVHVDGYRDSPY